MSVRSLKRLETVLIYDEAQEQNLFNFFSSQKELRTVFLNFKNCPDNKKLRKIVFHILESCPKLREFCFDYYDTCFELDEWYFERFARLTSRLKLLTLGLNNYGPSITPKMFPIAKGAGNLTILGLVKNSFSMTDEVGSALLQRYTSLEHLELSVGSDFLMQKILEFLVSDRWS